MSDPARAVSIARPDEPELQRRHLLLGLGGGAAVATAIAAAAPAKAEEAA